LRADAPAHALLFGGPFFFEALALRGESEEAKREYLEAGAADAVREWFSPFGADGAAPASVPARRAAMAPRLAAALAPALAHACYGNPTTSALASLALGAAPGSADLAALAAFATGDDALHCLRHIFP
jgi:hypothetical protein